MIHTCDYCNKEYERPSFCSPKCTTYFHRSGKPSVRNPHTTDDSVMNPHTGTTKGRSTAKTEVPQETAKPEPIKWPSGKEPSWWNPTDYNRS